MNHGPRRTQQIKKQWRICPDHTGRVVAVFSAKYLWRYARIRHDGAGWRDDYRGHRVLPEILQMENKTRIKKGYLLEILRNRDEII